MKIFFNVIFGLLICSNVSAANVSATPDSWENVNISHSGVVWSIAAGEIHTIAGSDGGKLHATTDGEDWTVHMQSLKQNGRYSNVMYGNGHFLASHVSSAGELSLIVVDDADLRVTNLQLNPAIMGASGVEVTDISYASEAGKFGVSIVSYHPSGESLWENHLYLIDASTLNVELKYTELSTFTRNFIGQALSPFGGFVTINGGDQIGSYQFNDFAYTDFEDNLRTITYAADHWIILSDSSAISYSPGFGHNAATTQIRGIPRGNWNDVTFENSSYVAVGDRGDIIYSLDGRNWIVAESGSTQSLHSVTYSAEFGWLAVGNNGTVLRQPKVINVVQGSPNDDFLNGSQFEDRILCGSGNDSAYGYEGDDYLSCYHGNDNISGGDGNDVILGGTGSDFINGGSGRDILRGGSGFDTFVYEYVADSHRSNPDRIIDFDVQEDSLDLTGLGYVGVVQGYPSGSLLAYIYNATTHRTYLRDADGFWIVFNGNIQLSTENVIF